ncbi:unnamed protein product [Victoria cruziana]
MKMEGSSEKATRVRLVFKGRGLLSKSQKSEGLRRCWLLLSPHIATVYDLTLHILRSFNQDDLCPNGLILSVEGFVLPLFESVCILRDSDIIRVSRKINLSMEIFKGQNTMKNIEDAHNVQRQPLLSGVNLLAFDEFEKEAGGYQSEYESEPEHDENAFHSEKPVSNVTAKKRKQSCADQGSRKKKAIMRTTGKNDENENKVDGEKSIDFCNGQGISVKQIFSVGKSNTKNGQGMKVHPLKTTSECIERYQTKITTLLDLIYLSLPSRSARRKKAKRLWLREMANAKSIESMKNNSPEKDFQMKFSEREHDWQDVADDDEVMPVVVKPGHIRFEPISGEDARQDNGKHEDPAEVIKWNGTTCKRKGQKWGKEKTSAVKVDAKLCEKEDLMFEKGVVADNDVDFEQLAPLIGAPEVGKVSFYNPESSMVRLVPVPGYPLPIQHNQEEGPECPMDTSLYKEDGSLEIEFRSLVDIRILNHGKGNQFPICAAGEMNGIGVPSRIQGDLVAKSISGDEQNEAMIQENGQISWDEISRALNEKKTALWKKVENGKKKVQTAKSSWSYKSLRGSALGPTIAYLRAENRI